MAPNAPPPPTRLRRAGIHLLRVLRLVAVAYLLTLLVMTFIERWLVYPAPSVAEGEWNPTEFSVEDAEFASRDGTRLHGWFYEHDSPERVILLLHGNGEHVASAGPDLPFLSQMFHASVMVFDYRGYGRSGGRPHEAGIIEDGIAASKWLAQRTGVPPGEQVLIGRSIGGAIAIAMAERQGAGCLVLQNTFARLTDVAARLFPWFPVRYFMFNRYPSIERIQNYHGPVFSCHGTADRLVPFAQGRAVFEVAPTDRKQFYALEDLDHNDPPTPNYWRQLAVFLDGLEE